MAVDRGSRARGGGSSPASAVASFSAGVRAVFGGLGFIVTTPSAWGWAAFPALVATLLFGGTGALAIWGGDELTQHLLAAPAEGGLVGAGTGTIVAMWSLRILFGLVGLVVAFFVAMSLAQPISGFALDALARKQEIALGGRTWPDQAFFAGMVRSLRVALGALAIGLPVLGLLALVTFLFPPAGVVTIPLKFVVTGILAAYDLLDYPLSQRGQGVRARVRFMRDNFAAVLGFGVSVAALLLVPGMALLLLPVGVAGATRLVVRAEEAG